MTNVLILGASGQLARKTTRVFLRDTAEGRNAALKSRGDDVKQREGGDSVGIGVEIGSVLVSGARGHSVAASPRAC